MGVDWLEVKRVANRLAEASPTGWLSDTATYELLTLCGVPVPEWRVAINADDVALAAKAIGFPVVLKAIAADLLHKSDEKGVVLDVASAEQASAIAGDFAERFGTRLQGILVQRQCAPGIELFVGINHESHTVPVLVIGAGGTDAEILDDRRVCVAPLNENQARDALLSLRLSPKLTGYRTHPAVSLDPIVSLICRIGLLATVVAEITELDLNHIVITSASTLAVDARIRMAQNPQGPQPLQAMRRL